MTPWIWEAAVAEPAFEYEQATLRGYVTEWLRGRAARTLALVPSIDHQMVERRRFAVPVDLLFGSHSFAERNAMYVRCALDLGERAVRACLDKAAIAPGAIDHFISTSCTGFTIPSLDAYVAHRFGMKSTLSRLPITEHGCAGGAVALARAAEHLHAYPEHVVLVLSVELASLTFLVDDVSAENVISAGMFGDGAAAVLLRAKPAPGRPRIAAAGSRLFPDSAGLMGFLLTEAGLKIVLSREIPEAVRRQAVPAITGFLEAQGLTLRDVDHWLLHPGGRRIVECFEEAFGLGDGGLAHSRRVLAEHGNLSSATVLYMLEDFFGQGIARPGDVGLLAAFGPGFGAELLILEW